MTPYTVFKGQKKDIDSYLWEVYNAGKIFMLRGNKLYQLHHSENAGFNFTVLYTADKKTNYCGRGRHLFVNAAACNHILGFNLVID